MPFTLSHAVVALPFRRARALPTAAVAAGAIVPDLPLFAPVGVPYAVTHEVWGALTVDVVLGAVGLLLWSLVLRPGLVAVLPRDTVRRLPADAARPTMPPITPLLPVGLALGSLTHVVWDAFTHAGRWGTVLVPALTRTAAGLPLASWGQYASSVLGLALLAGWAVLAWRREPDRGTVPVLGAAPRRSAAAATLLAALAGGAMVASNVRSSGMAAVAFAGTTGAVDGAVAALLVVGVLLALRPGAR